MNRKQRRAESRTGEQRRTAGSPVAPIAGWFSGALAYQRAGRVAEAERVCLQILSLEPGHAQTLHLLGLIEHQCGRSDDAIQRLRMAIARNGQDPAFHHNLGNILRSRNRPAEALTCYEHAIALAPDSVDTLYNLGNICQDLGRPERAIAFFERALRLKPDTVDLHNNLGTALQAAGRLDEAIACYGRALVLRPDALEALDNLASALLAQGLLDAARDCYERALSLRPRRIETHIGLGVVLRDQGRLDDAVARYELALALAPGHPETRNNLGVALVDLGRTEEAIAHYEKALAVQPDRAELHNNLGLALQRQLRCAEAIECYGRALALKPNYAEAHFNRACALLLTGNLDEGWREYEWRFAVARYDRNFERPMWAGKPLAGQTILLHAEQGFGDALQFLRFVPAVAERGGKVVLEAPAPLVRLSRTLSGVSEVIAAGDPLPAFDCHCPLLSLARILETNLDTIPVGVPYLSVPPEASATWTARIAAASGLKAGLVWAGNAVGAKDPRHIDFGHLRPLWEIAGISWFSLQVGDRAGDIASADRGPIIDLSPWLTDFVETAAAILQLDLVISVDTSVAHLAGALGRPTWVMLQYAPDWRWLLDRNDSPWYPTARLFRQTKAGDWPGAVRDVAEALAQMAH
jgi:tetratricopeptide (TPR) repeat protein